MTELAAQWPILALVIVISGVFLRVIQKLYEERIRELREDAHFWREIALTGTNIADRTSHELMRRSKGQAQ